MNVELETERLLLRRFTPEDLDALARIAADPEVMRYIGSGRPMSRAETETALLSIIEGCERRGYGRWALIHKPGGELIGYCGLTLLDETVGVELAYLLDRAYWRNGLAAEAVAACLRHGFERLRLEKISAITHSGNAASIRLLEKVGLKFVRALRYYDIDCVQYETTREDFRAAVAPFDARRA